MKITVRSVMFKLSPSEKVKNPKSTLFEEKPTFKELKKKLLSGPLGKMLLNTNDNVEPIIPPIITPNTIFPNFLFAIQLLFCLKAKATDIRGSAKNPPHSLADGGHGYTRIIIPCL